MRFRAAFVADLVHVIQLPPKAFHIIGAARPDPKKEL
jgi:hypothetical protein